MSDFCQQCSYEKFGDDFGELADITTPEEWEKGLASIVICEGCGPIQVDPEGRCTSKDCLKKHGEEERSSSPPAPNTG